MRCSSSLLASAAFAAALKVPSLHLLKIVLLVSDEDSQNGIPAHVESEEGRFPINVIIRRLVLRLLSLTTSTLLLFSDFGYPSIEGLDG